MIRTNSVFTIDFFNIFFHLFSDSTSQSSSEFSESDDHDGDDSDEYVPSSGSEAEDGEGKNLFIFFTYYVFDNDFFVFAYAGYELM